jgi:hypothetical protein
MKFYKDFGMLQNFIVDVRFEIVTWYFGNERFQEFFAGTQI